MKNKLMKLLTLLLSILTIVCFAFACTPDSGGVEPEHTHEYAYNYDDKNHWEECECGDKKNSTAHSGGTATCKIKAVCATCNQQYGELGGHSGGTATCKQKAKCSICEQEYGDLKSHNYVDGRCECGEYDITCYTDGLVFELDTSTDTYSVTDYTGSSTEVVIPSIYQNKPVANIVDYAFSSCASLTLIEMPNSIESIGKGAFCYCDSLTSIEIPNSVTSIGEHAFWECSSLTSIEIPNSITNIGFATFMDCRSLTSVVIGNKVTSIGEHAFGSCYSLTSIEIPNSVTSIGDYAFYCCYKLVEVYNKSSLNITKGNFDNGYIGYYALDVYDDSSPSKLTTDSNGYVVYEDGEDKILVEYIGTDTELNNLPSEITEIYRYAFYCSDITSITIPSSVTSIGDYAFFYCSSLINVEITNNVTSIGSETFRYCSSLTSVVIGSSVTSIGPAAFQYCDSLINVYYGGNADDWTGINIGQGNSNLTDATLYYYVENESDLPSDDGNYWHYVDGVPTVWEK